MEDGTVIAREGGEAWPIVSAAADGTARYAAEELARFVSAMTACRVRLVSSRPQSGPAVELILCPSAAFGPDGFRRSLSAAGVAIEAATGRGLLYGVYDLLEDLGCRWYYPGPDGCRIPRRAELRLAPPGGPVAGVPVAGVPAAAVKEERPAFPGRSLILGHDLYLDDVVGWVEWAARNRLNGIFLHEFPPPDLGGRPASWWREALARAVPEARRRGLAVEFGGHGLAALLPRRLFRRHPDYFRFDGRRRTPDHNLCPSSPGALEVVARNARAYFAARPGADVYHLWPDDIVGGGWCRCERCAGLSASDQALLAINAAARVLAEVEPGAKLAFLAYHDTIEPARRVKPEPNVVLLYAPRERCYAHALDDAACEVNRPYHASLAAGAAALPWVPRVFEYYLDGVLFKSMFPPLPRVMAADLRAYLAAGVHTVGALMTSDRPHLAAPVNLWLWGRLTWDPEADLTRLVEDFAEGRLGDRSLAAYYAALEEAFARVLELDGQASGLAMPGGGLLDDPPRDTLDFVEGPAEPLARKTSQLAEAVRLAARAGTVLEAARPDGAPGPGPGAALAAEKAEFELTARQFDFLLARQQAVREAAAGTAASTGRAVGRDGASGAAAARGALGRAWRALGAVHRWGRRNLGGLSGAAQFLFFHAPWELQLLKSERRLQRAPAGRLRARDLAVLVRIGLRLAALRLGRRRRRLSVGDRG